MGDADITVYRIQSKQDKRRGAYGSLTSDEMRPQLIQTMIDAHSNMFTHPEPHEDGIYRYPNVEEHCGFDSAVKLLRWFRGFIPNLLRAGYEIVALQNVEITAIGKHQVLFKWNK